MTSMSVDSGLMCFAGPEGAGSSAAGTLLLRVALDPGAQGLFPWDVVTLPGSAECMMHGDIEWREKSTDAEGLFGDGGTCDPSRGVRVPLPLLDPSEGDVTSFEKSDDSTSNDNAVLVIASMHCGQSLRTSTQDRDCRLVVAKVDCSSSEKGQAVMKLVWQRSRSLPGYCGHANMMCPDNF